jgi:hypothetical protein
MGATTVRDLMTRYGVSAREVCLEVPDVNADFILQENAEQIL